MLNITVVNIKDLVKYLVSVMIIVFSIFGLTRFLNNNKEKEEITSNIEKVKEETKNNVKEPYFFCFERVVPGIKIIQDKNKEIMQDEAIMEEKESPLLKIMTVGLAMTENIKKDETEDVETKVENIPEKQEEKQEQEKIEEAKTGLPTEVVTENNTANNKYTMTCYGVNIKNESDNTITEDMLDMNIQVNKNKILLFHTHTCESYTPSPGYEYQSSRYF